MLAMRSIVLSYTNGVGPLHRMAGMEDTLQPVRPVAKERGQDTENQMPPKADSGEILAKGKALCGYRLHY